jgi:tetratricopeptide (TPR) repeat protein
MLSAMRLTLALVVVAACSREPRDPLRAISDDVRAGRYQAVAARIAAAELPERPRLAFRAASDAPPQALAALAAAATEPELATSIADRLEAELGPKAALAARDLAAAKGPDRAEHHDALARARLDAGQLTAALGAWDRAAAIAPLQPLYRLAPIRALVAAGARDRACARATAIAATAAGIEPLLLAASAAAACGDHPRAIELARAAQALRPGDGRLTFNLGEHLADAGAAEAITVLTDLLICGAHGRPWHRHEVAARVLSLATDAAAARRAREGLGAPRTCPAVDEADLAGYRDTLRARLDELAAPPAPAPP